MTIPTTRGRPSPTSATSSLRRRPIPPSSSRSTITWPQLILPTGDGTTADPGHDTISMLALDQDGNLAGCCTTSGLAYKMHGRVGDSPIIGAALFVDNEVGAACATAG